jgi:cellulose biosynthesis protein BcsQ
MTFDGFYVMRRNGGGSIDFVITAPPRAAPTSRISYSGRRPHRLGSMFPLQVVTVASNKGGVGKTTLATNLAVYVRALREDLPILVLGLDDQDLIDRMFALDASKPERTVLDALRDRDLAGAIRLGQYGVHYVSPSPVISNLEAGLPDPFVLRDLLVRSRWSGLVVIDTKSDLGTLTQNAVAASDLVLVAVSDQTSLDQAQRVFALLDAWQRSRERARILLSLVDRRVKYRSGEEADILGLLVSEVHRRGYPLLESFVSRSPKIESLYTNPEGRAHSILHGAHGSLIHRQMAHLADDVLRLLPELPELGPLVSRGGPPAKIPRAAEPVLWSVEELLGPTQAAEPPGEAVPARARDAGPGRPEPPLRSGPHDRRRRQRHAFPRRIHAFRLHDPPILELQGRDLSLGGVGTEPIPELGVGTRVHLAFAPKPGLEPLLVWARVVRAGSQGAGLCFEPPEDVGDCERLAALVADLAPPARVVAPEEKRISAGAEARRRVSEAWSQTPGPPAASE